MIKSRGQTLIRFWGHFVSQAETPSFCNKSQTGRHGGSGESRSLHDCLALPVLDVKWSELAFIIAIFVNREQDADFVSLVMVVWLDCALFVDRDALAVPGLAAIDR